MGGSVAIGVRFPDGKTVCQEMWTNSMSYWITDSKTFNFDVSHIENYLASDDKPVALPFAPYGYGLFVIDCVTKSFIDMQGYADVDLLSRLKVMSGPQCQIETARIATLLLEKRLSIYDMLGREVQPMPDINDFNSLLEYNKTLNSDYAFKVDMSPAKLVSFEESDAGASAMKKHLEGIGFEFSNTDNEAWQNYIDRFAE